MIDGAQELALALPLLVGPDVRTAAIAIEDALVDRLWPEEAALVARAVMKRKRELAAGRVLARRLLAELGLDPAPLLAGEDRAPIWPEGIVGSISHTDELCGVAVARASAVASIGLDVETRRPLKRELWSMVMTEDERRVAEASGDPGAHGMLVFSAKEAVYKCQYPFTRTILDFEDVVLAIDPATSTFAAEIVHPVGRAVPGALVGRYAWGTRFVASAVVLRAT